MHSYQFRYGHGQSHPYKTLEAASDNDFYDRLAEWERSSGFRHIKDSIKCTRSETVHVPEPPASRRPLRALTPGEAEIANRIGMPETTPSLEGGL